MLKRTLWLLLCITVSGFAMGQFPPPAGQPGSTAIYKDSSIFKNWASGCTVIRGYVNLADTTVIYPAVGGSNHATYGEPGNAIGAPDDFTISLGDGGSALVTFPVDIKNGDGPDFAVFENGLSDQFLELAFVEVSSDGTRFVRFPATSNVQDTIQVSTFGSTDATRINNLAGKYRVNFGTPFDLEDLRDSANIDLGRITVIRIRDAVGSIDPGIATYDALGHIINDPFPTPFNTGGFDLDAVGAINVSPQSVIENENPLLIHIFPNPVKDFLNVTLVNSRYADLSLTDITGKPILPVTRIVIRGQVDLSMLPAGIYLISAVSPDGNFFQGKIVKQ